MENTTSLLPLSAAARRLRVPSRWLRTEAEAGRLPHLRADDRLLFDLELVRGILLERSRLMPSGPGGVDG
jgi:hypothetical protein